MDVQVVEIAAGIWHARARHVGWVLLSEGNEVTLVDTGYPGDRDRVIASLARIGHEPADVAAVVLTHAHPDHLGSAEYFRRELSTRVLAHEREVANADGSGIEQVSTSAILRRAWRRMSSCGPETCLHSGPSASNASRLWTPLLTTFSTYLVTRCPCTRQATRQATAHCIFPSRASWWPATR